MNPEIKRRIEQIRRGEVPEEYKKAIVGIIPDSWEPKKLKDICEINPPRKKKEPAQTTFLGMSDVDDSGHIIAQHKMDIHQIKSGLTPFERGDILVAKITPCFENGKGANTKTLQTETGFGSTEFHVLRNKKDGDFIFYHTISHSFRQKLEREMTGSAGQKRVQVDSLGNYVIPLPGRSERRSIVDILSAQDSIIVLKEKRLAEKQQQKKYIMQQLLTGKRRLPGFEGVWKYIPAREIFKSITDKKHSGDLQVLSSTQDRGIVPRDQVGIDIKYEADSLSSYKKVEKGNFVISLRSFQGGIEYSDYTGIVSPAYTVLKSIEKISDEYYKQFFKSTDYINRLNIAVYGIRDGKQISYEDFGRIKIPYPSLNEQTAIAKVLSTADREIDLLRQDIEQEKQKKKALMQLLLTGIVRVTR
ncbi:restriction endonuclease subunit S [uncultured Subdoligranulum sp.]|uniref:restriction endonuclease subunit S n=1 Tax=uncultured Subdoligranulum sp. TaxID=512298 RepID=UPI003208D28F